MNSSTRSLALQTLKKLEIEGTQKGLLVICTTNDQKEKSVL